MVIHLLPLFRANKVALVAWSLAYLHLGLDCLPVWTETLLEVPVRAVVALPLVVLFDFVANALASFVHRLGFVVLGLECILVEHRVIWLHQDSHFVALTGSFERVFLGADHIVAVGISVAWLGHALVGVILVDSRLGLSIGYELTRMLEVDFAHRNLVGINSLLAFDAFLRPTCVLADFISLCEIGFITGFLVLLIYVLLGAIANGVLGAVIQVFALQIIRCIPVAFDLDFRSEFVLVERGGNLLGSLTSCS